MKDDTKEMPQARSDAPRRELPPPAPAAAKEAAPAAPTRTPQDWAERLGHIKRGNPLIPQSKTHADWQHAAADQLHGWTKDAYHFAGEPLLLTQADYEAALAAAAEYPTTPAHEPAMSRLLKPKEKV